MLVHIKIILDGQSVWQFVLDDKLEHHRDFLNQVEDYTHEDNEFVSIKDDDMTTKFRWGAVTGIVITENYEPININSQSDGEDVHEHS